MPEKQPSIFDDLERIFGKFNRALKANLDKYQLSEVYGYFIAIAFITSLSLGIAASYKDIGSGMINFGEEIIIYTLLTAFVFVPLFSYVFVHLYKSFYQTADTIKTAMSWQIIALFFSVLLTFVLTSEKFIYSGFVVFGVILFVYPLMKIVYANKVTVEDFNKKIKIVYIIALLIINLIQLILNFAHLL